MSEQYPEGAPASAGFMTKKFMGIPAIVWLIGAALLAYLYFRNHSGSSGGATSTGGGGSSTTGNISLKSAGPTIDVVSQYAQTQTSNHNTTTNNNPPPRHRTHNPQPKPPHRKNKQTHHTTVKHPGKSAAEYVTVGKWPGKSSGGLAQWNTTVWGIAHHFNESVASILKLNPQIKNANLVHPGERVRVK